MTAQVIRYIRFSLYNFVENTVLRLRKTWKNQGISFFFQIFKHPGTLVRKKLHLSLCEIRAELYENNSLSNSAQMFSVV